ncbi:MAG: carbohydrate-binding family 9-like protein [Ginsengibacter sp.]
MNYCAKICLSVCTFCLSALLLYAQSIPATNTNLIVKPTGDFTVTGDGSAAEWNNTGWNTIIQRDKETLEKEGWKMPPQPGNSRDISYKTTFKILYSDKGIYCLYKCEDSAITATITEDYGALYNEDVVELFLRPDTSLPAYFEYELSPLNYELPIMILNNKGNATGWKPWQYDGTRKIIHAVNINKPVNPGGRFTWTAEFFIPYTLLAPTVTAPPAKGTMWRANFYRIDYDRNPVYSSWQLTRQNYHDYERFGIIEFD